MTKVQSGFESAIDSDIFENGNDGTAGPTVFDDLEAALKAPVKNPDKAFRVPGRPGISLMCDTNIDSDVLSKWRKRAKDKQDPDGYNGKRFSAVVIANQVKQVYFNGEPRNGADNEPLNFRHMQLLSMLGTPSAQEAVALMFGNDGQMLQCAMQILEAAGYAEEDMEADSDPTDGFSKP